MKTVKLNASFAQIQPGIFKMKQIPIHQQRTPPQQYNTCRIALFVKLQQPSG